MGSECRSIVQVVSSVLLLSVCDFHVVVEDSMLENDGLL